MRSVLVALCVFYSHVLQLSFSLDYRPAHHCPDLRLISLGRVNPFHEDSDYDPPVIGDVATYSCVQGYRVVGDVTRTCILTVNGTAVWSGTEPYCDVVDCGDPGVPANAVRHGSTYTYGARVWYSCHNFTTLVGSATLACKDDGQWSGDLPICRKYGSDGYCRPIRSLKNGLMVGGKKVGESMWFVCRNGYTMLGPSRITCQLNRTWSDSPPVCVLGCDNPPAVSNGQASALFIAINHYITYSCDPCYELKQSATLKCLPNSTWSQSTPECIQVTCENPMKSVSVKRDHLFSCDAELTFECSEGFRLVGSHSLRCMATGNWSSSMPVCEYAPEIGTCPELIPPANGLIAYRVVDSLTIAEYSCNAGYRLRGGVVRSCNDSGKWNGTAPSCVDADSSNCPLLEAPSNGFVVIAGFNPGDNATYFCNDNHIIMNGDQVRRCTTNDRWTGNAPTCNKVEPMCRKPADLLNARYTVTMPVSSTIDSDQLHHNVVVMGGTNKSSSSVTDAEDTDSMFLLGSMVKYYCDKGFVMGGSGILMCFTNGSWIGNIGECKELMCPQPDEEDNSFVIPDGFSVGATATYYCYHGFFASANSPMTITCQEFGNWTKLIGGCLPAVCEYPQVKDDVIVSGSAFTYASEGIQLKCARNRQHRVRKKAHSKCLSNSTWSVQSFTCSGGLCPESINFQLCNSTDFALIGTVKSKKRSYVIVTVKKMLYQRILVDKEVLKILTTDSSEPLSNSQSCCKRLTVKSTYIFAGTYSVRNNKIKYTTNGCRTVYNLPAEQRITIDVNNVQHDFVNHCRFRMSAFNNS